MTEELKAVLDISLHKSNTSNKYKRFRHNTDTIVDGFYILTTFEDYKSP